MMLACKLTSAELKLRKETVISQLKLEILNRKELSNGFAYKFPGTDIMVDQLAEFVKTERTCCDFFDFGITVKGNGRAAWLKITGPSGAKEFIVKELSL